MPRPRKCRRICSLPLTTAFGPSNVMNAVDMIELTLDEYEMIRLIDFLGGTQEECARQMGIARTTVQAGYNDARKKIADALINGKHLSIRGGDYAICASSNTCCKKACGKERCSYQKCGEIGGCQNENCSYL